jgi:hypothetical protein
VGSQAGCDGVQRGFAGSQGVAQREHLREGWEGGTCDTRQSRGCAVGTESVPQEGGSRDRFIVRVHARTRTSLRRATVAASHATAPSRATACP